MGKAFRIIIQEGGGFSGLTTGYTLSSNGKVEYWRQFPGKEKTIVWEKEVDPQNILRFRKELEASNVLSLELKEYGNMTTTITYIRGDEKYSWHWSKTVDNSRVPPALQKWYREVSSFCRSLAPDQQK